MFLFLFNAFVFVFECSRLLINISFAFFEFFVSCVWKASRKSVEHEIVLITGAGSGIGKQLSIEFARLGAILVLWDINKEKCEQTAAEIKRNGGVCYCYTVDVSIFDEVEQTSLKVRQGIGDVYLLINNAAVFNCATLLNLSPRDIKKAINTNLMSHFWTTKCFLPQMIKRGKGHIVAISSNMGLYGRCYLTDYSATKFGINGFMEALDDELRVKQKNDIFLTTVCPSAIDTGLSTPRETRFPKLLPVMTVEYACKVIVDGILRDKRSIIFPTGFKLYYYILR
ncbi:17-beta-hydroxysteroid dehydrogenase 13-like isoform X1 [Leptotrombidium deliense]|uniref:Short-chain dehydrogenase/reductase 3 n=1 Tax=Leptotrombidium deliense TaxID=299467 RepID=A0A443SD38_9ACAR|nr:17-beta-hydroxysteroid dehydrogenase 13-like isoform X1 [Leptotrombidium deliense]